MREILSIVIALFGLCASGIAALAQERGALTVEIAGSGSERKSHRLYSASHALVIGIDKYTEKGWPPLRNAVRDAGLVAEALKAQGFEVSLRTDLTSAELFPALQAFFISKGRDPEARLLLWFAGHGHTITLGGSSEEGYIVPADAPSAETDTDFRLKAVALRQFNYLMTQAKAKHVLAVLDSCFSGNVLAITRDAELTTPPEITLRTDGRARQMISAGDRNQKVADNGTFRQLFIDAITGKARNLGANGYVTARELGDHLRREMAQLTARTATPQTPNTGYLNEAGFNHGDFVFKVPGVGAAVPVAASDATPKAVAPAPAAPAAPALPPVAATEAVAGNLIKHTLAVEFRSMAEWQQISRPLAQTDRISDLDVVGLSALGGKLTLRYPGDVERLAAALAANGLLLRSLGGQLVLTLTAQCEDVEMRVTATLAEIEAQAYAAQNWRQDEGSEQALEAIARELAELEILGPRSNCTGLRRDSIEARVRALKTEQQRLASAGRQGPPDSASPTPPAAPPAATPDPKAHAGAVQVQLARLGCFSAQATGDWGPKTREALEQFNKRAAKPVTVSRNPLDVDINLLRSTKAPLCPPQDCKDGETEKDGKCEAAAAPGSPVGWWPWFNAPPPTLMPWDAPVAATKTAPITEPSAAAKDLYEKAYGFLLQQDYAAAETAFSGFLAAHPTDALAGNAAYWLGELHFVRGQFKAAATAFLDLTQKFPTGAKAPDSYLKLAMSLDRLGQKDAACASFAELARRFPTAPAHVATRAKTERERLGCK